MMGLDLWAHMAPNMHPPQHSRDPLSGETQLREEIKKFPKNEKPLGP